MLTVLVFLGGEGVAFHVFAEDHMIRAKISFRLRKPGIMVNQAQRILQLESSLAAAMGALTDQDAAIRALRTAVAARPADDAAPSALVVSFGVDKFLA